MKPGQYYEIAVTPTHGHPYILRKRYQSESGAKKKAIRMATNDPNVREARVNLVTRTIYPSMPQRVRVFTWERDPLFEVVSL